MKFTGPPRYLTLKCIPLMPSDINNYIYWFYTVRIKTETENVWEHTNDNIVIIDIIVIIVIMLGIYENLDWKSRVFTFGDNVGIF